MKALVTLKKDQEAAGTKIKLLKHVNCISCDKEVVMRTELDTSLLRPPALPPTRSMGPYLAYELDELRKQQKWSVKLNFELLIVTIFYTVYPAVETYIILKVL